MELDSSIFIAGHKGLVGSALTEALQKKGYSNLLLASHKELDLTNQMQVENFFKKNKPEYVFLAAAKVGGILANNTYRADFLLTNLQIQNNVLYCSHKYGVKKLLFLGSSCIYPREAKQPIDENQLLTSELEYTNEPYAIAKIAGIKLCESYNLQYSTNFLSVMPTNLYGPNDNFHLNNSHVLPGMLRKMHLAHCFENNDYEAIKCNFKKFQDTQTLDSLSNSEIDLVLEKYGITKSSSSKVSLSLWGTGKPLREFLHVHDMADACIFVMENIDFKDLISVGIKDIKNTHINIGTGEDLSIKELSEIISSIVGFQGEIVFDSNKPDGTQRKLLNVGRINRLGWKHTIDLHFGIKQVYEKNML